jgi:hypothetical protein
MSRATPRTRAFANGLIAHEAGGRKSSATKVRAAFDVCEKLRPHLATLMGNLGFRALLSRALAVANTEVAWLRAVHVKADGSLEAMEDAKAKAPPEEMTEGSVVLVAQLLGLLVAFIGEHLTLQLLREVWPKLSFKDLGFDPGEKK